MGLGFTRMAIASLFSLALVGSSTPPASAASVTVGDRGGCSPKITLWKDSDQYGTYHKVNFSAGPCGWMILSGQVSCMKPYYKRLYNETVRGSTTRIRTITRSLPASCTRFYATASNTAVSEVWRDSWSWYRSGWPA